MSNLDRAIAQAFSDLQKTCGGQQNDYFGLIYMESEGISRDKAINQLAFGGNDYGIDGFHFDQHKKNLYIFQFKNSPLHILFKDSLIRLINNGIDVIFNNPNQDIHKNQILLQLRSCLIENRAIIDQVIFRFVFTGDPIAAERSPVLDKLREDLENKKYLIDRFFNRREVALVVDFRSSTGKVGAITDQRKTHEYRIPIKEIYTHPGPNCEAMHISFIKLFDLYRIYKDMGKRFFERNIRYGLGPGEAVNRAITRSLKNIILEGKESPEIFTFNHNGISLYAENLDLVENCNGSYHIVEPRLLNGAQTVTTFAEFIQANEDNQRLIERKSVAEEIYVLCKIITNAKAEFVTTVTVNNNRQNPVEPWNLRANDMIQLELQEKFKDDLQIYYERQESAFENIDLEEEGIENDKPIELLKLAQTFLITDGNLQRISNFRQVFEDDNSYNQVFNDCRLNADTRHIILCYKIQFRLKKLINDILDKGTNKYAYAPKARYLLWALLCQGVLNDSKLPEYSEKYGQNLIVPADFTSYLSELATTRCRFLLAELTKSEKYAEKAAQGNYSFLRNNQAYEFCMDIAYKKYKWINKKLK